MAKKIETLFSAQETATWLRLKLGPIREWSTTLADMRRSRTTVSGLILVPFAMHQPDGNMRPLYRKANITEFVKRVMALGIAKPNMVQGTAFEFEEPTRHFPKDWTTRVLTRLPPATPATITTPTPASSPTPTTKLRSLPALMHRRHARTISRHCAS